MGSMDRVEMLRSRANGFCQLARKAFELGLYDHAMFNVEQCLQLYIKSLFLEFKGFIPEIHELRSLLSLLIRDTSRDIQDYVAGFVRRYRRYLSELEIAYTASRYMFKKSYEHSEVLEYLGFMDNALEFLNKLEGMLRSVSTKE